MNSRLLGAICAAVSCVILTLGLWPFYAPGNDVKWLEDARGISFGRYGTVYSSDVQKTANSAYRTTGSIEVWVQPNDWTTATFLAIYQPQSRRVLRLRQSLSDIELETGDSEKEHQTAKARLHLDHAFRRSLREKKPTFLTVTWGSEGTRVYFEGVLARAAPLFRIPPDALDGRIVVGDSPWQSDSFRGEIRALALYDVGLTPAQVLQHYLTWANDGHPDINQAERNRALYLFDERAGTVIHDSSSSGADLYIPATYTVTDKIALEPFWKEFNNSRSYWKSNLMNVIGFLPVGFIFYAYFVDAHPNRRAILVTVLVGAATSLTIEVLQAFLPTRDSGTTDLITNTLGTYLGVLCYRNIYSIVTEKFPWLAWLQAPRCDRTTEPLSETNGKSR